MSSYTDVEWANGQVLTETKLDQMQENLDYVRDSMRGRTVANQASKIEFFQTGTQDWSLRVNVGANEWTSTLITSSSYGELAGIKNKNIGTLTDGVAYLLAFVAVSGFVTVQLGGATFVASADANFLSIFAEVRIGATNQAAIRGYTAIVTRDNEGF